MQGVNLLDDSSYWTRQRCELVQWFKDRAPSFTEGYIGAVKLLHTTSFPGRVHFICHIVRDIYRKLPNSLGAKALPRPTEVFPDMVTKLAKLWEDFPPTDKSNPLEVNADIRISPQVYRHVAKIVCKQKVIANQPSVGKHLAIALFRSLDRRDDEYLHPWIINAFDTEYNFFVERAHLTTTFHKVPTNDGLAKHFEAFEKGFHSLIGPYFSGKDELDAIIQDTNTTAD